MGSGVRLRRGSVSRHLLTLSGALALVLAGFVLLAGPASAHNLPITGSAVCEQNGSYTVTYRVSPPLANLSWQSHVTSSHPTGAPVSPHSMTGTGASSFTIVQSDVPSGTTTASLTVLTTWSNGVHDSGTATVPLAGLCGGSSSVPVSTSVPVTSVPVSTSVPVTSVPVSTTVPVTSVPVTSVPVSTTVPVTSVPVTSPPVTSTVVSSAPPITSTVNAPPPATSSSAPSSVVISPHLSSAVNAPPPPTSAQILPSDVTHSPAVVTPSQSVQALTDARPAAALASTGTDGSVPRTLGLAAALALLGSLLLLLGHRRQHN